MTASGKFWTASHSQAIGWDREPGEDEEVPA